MSAIPYIRKGGSIPFQFDRSGQSLIGFTCTIIVKKRPEDTNIISRVITPTGRFWNGFLTSGETENLSPGRYELTGLIENVATGEKQTVPERFQIVTSWG